MKVTIKPINGINHTVVWHDESFITTFIESEFDLLNNGSLVKIVYNLDEEKCKHIATALPPLPKKLTDDNAKLLYDYEAHGLCLVGDVEEFCTGEDNDLGNTYGAVHILKYVDSMLPNNVTLLYAINEQNERVEIAIYDTELQK